MRKKNELYHYGRKGMKWYQHIFSQDIASGKGNANQSVSQKVTKETSDAISKVKSSVKEVGEGYKKTKRMASQKAKQEEISKMSDAELQQKINRMNLEKRYSELTEKDTRDGFDKANEILSVAGGVAAVAVSAATIASTIYTMKKKQSGGN